mmetsp:Transcript_16038/g.22271  ORF Transcript_16038/g.22271 Transcript_16038/m.22271 type:complete len:457 (+) Transcript_16038:73-1443(+)|eukprot:CAMPEP_0201489488 /NCGR_PEP_ID=MMETSP0151_2-20130828/22835_1 /ASSEMBLY_ACC=CAM_ASM_000257 /TAXON_ID=200890 /ORGANISM="Paramoeba atlantica, Strain 621/1 / CCAP 1560/9" /LENGTH=456 /DNA_ID=CAMNT_0047875099 /DNA_START=73 /DNA_END=1443 /DNA_ORIENTATION=+
MAESAIEVDEDDVKYEAIKDDSKEQYGLIRAATLERLVERLTHEKIADPKFRKAFLLTYRSFTTPLELILALSKRYEPSQGKNDEKTSKRVRVVGVVKAWMEDHFYDFNEPEVQDALTSFIDEMADTMENSAKQLRRVFERAKERNKDEEKLQGRSRESVPAAQEADHAKILETKGWQGIDNKVLAEQMTILESDIYCAILPKECISWNKKEKEILAPNISAMIKQFNLFSNWVSCALVTQVTLEGRVETLKKFIDLMDELQTLNNFNGMMEVLSGINSSSVRRMKKTFAALDADCTKKFEKVEELLAHKFSYKVYRDHLHKINPPCVPYMGVYLTDLTFLSDGNPDSVDGGLINFKKRRLIAEVIDEIHQYQVRYLKRESVDCIQKWLTELPNMDDDTKYKWSRRVEPKDNEAVIEELIKSEENLNAQIAEYEAKIKALEEAIKKEEESQSAPAE